MAKALGIGGDERSNFILVQRPDEEGHYLSTKTSPVPCERAGWRSFRGKEPDETKERNSRMIEETSA